MLIEATRHDYIHLGGSDYHGATSKNYQRTMTASDATHHIALASASGVHNETQGQPLV